MIEGKTKSGFKYKVDERVKKDWRLVRAIANSQKDDADIKLAAIVDMIQLVLGDQEELLMQHIMKKNDGFVPLERMQSEITEIITSVPDLKN